MTTTPTETVQLRPLGVGDIIDGVLRMYRQRPWLFLTLAAIPNLISVLIAEGARLLWPNEFVDFDQLAFVNDPQLFLQQFRDLSAGRPGDTIVFFISLIPQSFSIAALTFAAANTYLGRRVSVGSALRVGVEDLLRVLFTFVVIVIVGAIVYIAAIVVSTLPAAFTRIGILSFLIVIAAVVVPIWLIASLVLAPTIAAMEDSNPFSAMRRAMRLIAGSRWRVIGLLVLLFIVQIVLSTLLASVFLAAFAAQSTAGQIAAVLVSAAATILWEPLPWATLALFYFDMRIRKEAYDLQIAAEGLPSTS